MRMLAAIALSTEQAAGLAEGAELVDLRGYAPTAAMLDAFELSAGEDAEYVALLIARAAGLLDDAALLVTAEVAVHETEPAEFGAVTVPVLRLADVHGVFVDDDPAAAVRAAAAVEGADLDEAWESPATQTFLGEHDLLWHHPGELADLL
ncbi:hypothetical protein GGQ54_000392 [Naumannella cuiyingiana]|uniref:Uncharacterized protein n=1 Tax=Naumannella cuiyingiana TaxID=1347891 RepID=A0A7Z0IJW6_9ACTN|nr:hypothetical protein [Naumannella cuiyingiana]NYI69832.1 hypothetical protein [Naumannella cuiyingiana]